MNTQSYDLSTLSERARGLGRVLALLTVSVWATALLAGCGGGGGGEQRETGTTTVRSTSSMDGLLTETLVGPNPVETMNTAGEPTVGFSDAANLTFYRAVFSYDLSSVPAGATIKSASLWVWQRDFQGDFLGNHSGIAISHLRVTAMPPAFAFASQEDYFAGVPADSSKEYKTVDVARQVANDRSAGRAYSSFLLWGDMPQGTSSGQTHLIRYTDGENTKGGQPPVLVVEWER